MRTLDVHFRGTRAGRLVQTDSGQLSFAYDAGWLASGSPRPLSLSLPLRPDPFDDRETRPFFAGLLPEDAVRQRLARYLQVSDRNEFALLQEIGGECAGAVALYPAGHEPPPYGADPPSYRRLTSEQLADILRHLPERPLLVDTEMRLSLAGAQDKIAVCVVDGDVAIPLGDTPTTHILKPPIERFRDTVVNELFCLRLAARLGLRAARAEVRHAEDIGYLLVERYDRRAEGDGRTRRLHQEDMCQALGIPPETKYQSEGGPSLAQCFDLLTRHGVLPAVDRLALLDGVIYNFLAGNADAHGKNLSLIHESRGVRLADLYDILSTVVYPGLSPKMAMKIGSRYRFDEVLPRHWEALASDVGLTPRAVHRRLRAMAQRIRDDADAVRTELAREHVESPLLEEIIAGIRKRAGRVLSAG